MDGGTGLILGCLFGFWLGKVTTIDKYMRRMKLANRCKGCANSYETEKDFMPRCKNERLDGDPFERCEKEYNYKSKEI